MDPLELQRNKAFQRLLLDVIIVAPPAAAASLLHFEALVTSRNQVIKVYTHSVHHSFISCLTEESVQPMLESMCAVDLSQ